MDILNRRGFLEGSAATLAAASLPVRSARANANDTIRAAVLGVNSRGRTHIEHFEKVSGVQVAVLCDPDEKILAQRAKEFEKRYGRTVETETDMRKVFDRKDVDVVGVATPNHWHSLATIWACQAGKDVYVEKPGSHNIFEGRKMIEAAHKHNRIVQHGVQLRSSPAIREAVDHMRNGLIGDVYMARGLVFRWRPSIKQRPDKPAPPHLDWDLWQGPAQCREFSERLVHYDWHWHWNYGNGDIGNQGIHETDMCIWGLGVEDQFPSEIVSMGGKFLWDDDKETPEVLCSAYRFPEQNKMIEFEVRHWCTNREGGAGVGNIFYGSKGYLVVKGYDTYESYLGEGRTPGPKASKPGELGLHFQNFIEAVRTRDSSILHGPVETAHYSSGLAHLGNIAYRLNRRLEFDSQAEQFVGDDEANAMLTRDYRAPFVVPEKV